MGSTSALFTNSRTSMVFAVLGATFLISSSSMTTYLSFSYSYPLTSSARGTGLSSAWQYSTCLTRELSCLWSWLKLTVSLRAALYNLTGKDTRPKVRWPFHTVEAIRNPLQKQGETKGLNIYHAARSGAI